MDFGSVERCHATILGYIIMWLLKKDTMLKG